MIYLTVFFFVVGSIDLELLSPQSTNHRLHHSLHTYTYITIIIVLVTHWTAILTDCTGNAPQAGPDINIII